MTSAKATETRPVVREPLDLRLAAGAGGAWLAVLCCVSRSPACSAEVALACAASAALLLVVGRR